MSKSASHIYDLRSLHKVRKRRTSTNCWLGAPPKKTLRHSDFTERLPNEILVCVFAFLPWNDLFFSVKLVCKRWYHLAMSPTLWKTLEVRRDIPTNVLRQILKSAPLLRELTLISRNDANEISHHISRHCPHIETITMRDCWGSQNSITLGSNALCRLATKCPRLSNFNFAGVKIQSSKFFKLITRRGNTGRVAKICHYSGPVNVKQIKVLIQAIMNSNLADKAYISSAPQNDVTLDAIIQRTNSDLETINLDDIWREILELHS